MDLGVCPKCGSDWLPGREMCRRCGYVAIGAGLRSFSNVAREDPIDLVCSPNAPEDLGKANLTFTNDAGHAKGFKKYTVALFRDFETPGKAGFPAQIVCFAALLGFFQFVPWRNDWEAVRVVTGDQRATPAVGSWEITENKAVGSKVPLRSQDELGGFMTFYPDGRVRLDFQRGHLSTKANGRFEQIGSQLLLRDLKADGEGQNFPPKITINVTWTNNYTFAGEVEGKEIIVLERIGQDPFQDQP